MLLLPLSLLALLAQIAHTSALAVPPSHGLPTRRYAFTARAPQSSHHPVSAARLSAVSSAGEDTPKVFDYGFTRADDQIYTCTILVNGVPFQVLLDTGSADSWIDPWSVGGVEIPDLVETGVNSSTVYVDGSSSTGPIVLADVTFGPFVVRNQAITLAYGASGSSVNPGFSNGLLGLAGGAASSVFHQLENTTWAENGAPIMYNLFSHQPDLAPYSTWLPSHTDIGLGDGGVLTFGEVLADKTAVLDAPRMDSVVPSEWTVLMDGIFVDGKFLTGHSNNSEAFKNLGVVVDDDQTIATFDTGTSFIRAPDYYVDAIFGSIPNSQRIVDEGEILYEVPCDTRLNISFVFGGIAYPLDPADAHRVVVWDDGELVCLSSFIGGDNFGRDWLLGDTFLRSVYSLWSYGDGRDALAPPSIQLHTLVDPDAAYAAAATALRARALAFAADFASTRATPVPAAPATARPVFTGPHALATASLTRAALHTAFPAAEALPTEDDDEDEDEEEEDWSRAHVIAGALGGVLFVGLVVVGAARSAVRCADERARARDRGRRAWEYLPLRAHSASREGFAGEDEIYGAADVEEEEGGLGVAYDSDAESVRTGMLEAYAARCRVQTFMYHELRACIKSRTWLWASDARESEGGVGKAWTASISRSYYCGPIKAQQRHTVSGSAVTQRPAPSCP
ncbi:aspartic peptidase domain-containing protein [Epithele typhae]|uniref:aspartic peptidase domain-containing protein n=1 Tax=Epithele typhae TaxID=378194 RepID=UPI0020082FAB|nr:aspartic peptidase domain-containing protein [Epithele typhae]KAH9934491.1 aspartic peptidase domain-containing protein [Epithele typhae]